MKTKQRSLALTNIPNSEIRTRVRLTRNTRKVNFSEGEQFPIPPVILHRNTVLPITQSFVLVRTTLKFTNFSSTLNNILQVNAIHSLTTETTIYAFIATTESVTKPTNTIGVLLLVQEMPNEAPLLRTHDQQIVRSSRISASKLL